MPNNFETPPHLEQASHNPEAAVDQSSHSRVRVLAGRLALTLVLTAGASVGLVTGESAIHPEAAHAATTFTNDYPDAGAALYNQAHLDWWEDENKNGIADVTLNNENDNDESVSSRGYFYKNCTDGVAYWVNKYTGYVVPSGWGNAMDWDNHASVVTGISVYDGTTNNIEPGDIAQSDDGDYGHVGFVTSVTKDSNGNVTSFKTAELNQRDNGEYNVDTPNDYSNYGTRNASGKFARYDGKDWDHFIDVNGTNKGLNNEDLTTVSPPETVTTTLSRSSSGPISSILEPSNRRDIFVGTDSGKLDWSHFAPGESSWSTGEIASVSSAIKSVSSVLWTNGKLGVYFGTADGGLYESWYQPGGGWTTSLIANEGSSVNGIAAQVINSSSGHDEVDVFSGSSNGNVYETWWQSNASWTNSLIDATGSPVNAVALLRPGATAETDIFAGSANGQLSEAWWLGSGGWNSGVSANFGSAITSLVAMMYGNADTVYAGTASGALDEAYWSPGNSWNTTTPGSASTPLEAITGLTTSSNQVDILTGNSNGGIGERYWSAGANWAGGDITTLSAITLGMTNIQQASGERDVYSISGANTVVETYWVPTSSWVSHQIGTAGL
ncbi:MAG: hypothetical protein JWN38_574 [Candidatus Saccharibacteria bacterium]|nr:hypothetical protein [Candidatus Saccharibacteria bacterium]